MKVVQDAIAADERFEHLVPAEAVVMEFAVDCAADRQADHAKAFVERHGRDASERVCYFSIESLRVNQVTEVAGIRLLPLDHLEFPATNPMSQADLDRRSGSAQSA